MLVAPIPIPVPLTHIPSPYIESDSSSGTLEIVGRPPQIFLPEQLYLDPGTPTHNWNKNQSFLNHCHYLLGNRPVREINHLVIELHSITPYPVVFAGYLWRYRITINQTGVLEDYCVIVRTTSLPVHTALQHTFTVYYDWNNTGLTISFDEWTSGKFVNNNSQPNSDLPHEKPNISYTYLTIHSLRTSKDTELSLLVGTTTPSFLAEDPDVRGEYSKTTI